MNTTALELVRREAGIVASQQNVIFDEVLIHRGSVSFDIQTGVITFNKTGRFLVNWTVVTQSALGAPDVTFAILSSQGDNIPASSPLKVGELSGFGIIEVGTVPVTLKLINKEEVDISFSTSASYKAHLIIGELPESDEGGPQGPTGPQGPQGPTGPQGPAGIEEPAGVQIINTQPVSGSQLSISSGTPIHFDNMTLQLNGVTYGDDMIQISEPGYYLITWQFIAKGTAAGQHVIVYLEDNDAFEPKVYGKSGSTESEFSLMAGTALVMVTNASPIIPFELKLVNRSSGTIEMSSAYNTVGDLSVHFAGALTVVKVGDVYYS